MKLVRSAHSRDLLASTLICIVALGCGCGGGELEMEPLDDADAVLSEEELRWISRSTPRNFDIVSFGMYSGMPSLKVAGRAGGTVPPRGSRNVYAYAFVTDAGLFLVASHYAEDSKEVLNDIKWHAHRVTLDANNCISAIDDTGVARLSYGRVSVAYSGARKVTKVLTLVLGPTANGVCITKVHDAMP